MMSAPKLPFPFGRWVCDTSRLLETALMAPALDAARPGVSIAESRIYYDWLAFNPLRNLRSLCDLQLYSARPCSSGRDGRQHSADDDARGIQGRGPEQTFTRRAAKARCLAPRLSNSHRPESRKESYRTGRAHQDGSNCKPRGWDL